MIRVTTKAIRPIAPAVRWRLAVITIGLSLACVVVATTSQFGVRRECTGAFSRGFNFGFDRYRCSLVLRHIPTATEVIRLRLF